MSEILAVTNEEAFSIAKIAITKCHRRKGPGKASMRCVFIFFYLRPFLEYSHLDTCQSLVLKFYAIILTPKFKRVQVGTCLLRAVGFTEKQIVDGCRPRLLKSGFYLESLGGFHESNRES